MQGFARAIHGTPHHLAGASQVHGPVQTQHVAIELTHLFKPQAAAFGENNAGNAHAQVLFLQQRQHFGGVGQAELLECRIGQHAAPTVKNHDGLRTSFNLGVEVGGHSLRIDLQNAVHQIRTAVQHGFNQTVVVRTFAFHHVTSQGPRAA